MKLNFCNKEFNSKTNRIRNLTLNGIIDKIMLTEQARELFFRKCFYDFRRTQLFFMQKIFEWGVIGEK